MAINFNKNDKYRLNGLLLFLIFALTGVVSGQEAGRDPDSNLIKFNVTVGIPGGFISGLRSNNFLVYDEGKQQPITLFNQEDAPVSVGILYDVSTSPKARDKTVNVNKVNPILLNGLKRFIELSNVRNEYFFLTFNETQKMLSDYTQDTKSIFKTVEQAENIKAEGGSNLYDAIGAGMEKLSKGKYSKRVLIVITDGLDGDSKIKHDELETKLKSSDILLFAYGIYKSTDGYKKAVLGESKLDELADQTGGYFFYHAWNPMTKGDSNDKMARGIFAEIANELRSQYSIGFVAGESNNQKSNSWREVKIRVTMPSGVKGIENGFVRTRKGYYSNSK